MAFLDAKSDEVRPTDTVLRCPNGHKGGVSIAVIRTPVSRNGKYVSIITGDVFACQRCQVVYAATDEGVYQRHPESLPIVGPPEEPSAPVRGRPPLEDDDPRETLPTRLRLTPKEAPRTP